MRIERWDIISGLVNQTLNPEQLKMATTFVACMRQLGYDMPEASDPGFNFAPKNADGMDGQQLQQIGKDQTQCLNKAGASDISGG
ncbi:hypothetical protein [Actinomadura rubrisoli]|uniref:Uncharacterized protein n=1 Tax=Actinomadura rubrisoli TaxID=2530368 RepID=A0A4R5AP98_9ACTN|nr:hypothetical protein [Actinomadura rubrisoli]TDD72864.1 hypothetical protein E1298_34620 [Actinomadura rubrisoli]